jgi:hypothetical protein
VMDWENALEQLQGERSHKVVVVFPQHDSCHPE